MKTAAKIVLFPELTVFLAKRTSFIVRLAHFSGEPAEENKCQNGKCGIFAILLKLTGFGPDTQFGRNNYTHR